MQSKHFFDFEKSGMPEPGLNFKVLFQLRFQTWNSTNFTNVYSSTFVRLSLSQGSSSTIKSSISGPIAMVNFVLVGSAWNPGLYLSAFDFLENQLST